MRCIRAQADGLISGLPQKELSAMSLGLAHRLNSNHFLNHRLILSVGIGKLQPPPELGTLKMRDMKQRHQNAGVETARKESASGVAGPLAAWCGGQICCPIVLGFGKWLACLKPRVLMPKVTCSIYSVGTIIQPKQQSSASLMT